VVVGVSGAPASIRALAWAHDVCRRRGWLLDVVTAWPDLHEAPVHEVPGHYCAPRGRALAALRTALAACAVDVRRPSVQVYVENADPVSALLGHSRGAVLLVVGAAHGGRSRRAGYEPVAEACRRVAACPVCVVDGEHAGSRRAA